MHKRAGVFPIALLTSFAGRIASRRSRPETQIVVGDTFSSRTSLPCPRRPAPSRARVLPVILVGTVLQRVRGFGQYLPVPRGAGERHRKGPTAHHLKGSTVSSLVASGRLPSSSTGTSIGGRGGSRAASQRPATACGGRPVPCMGLRNPWDGGMSDGTIVPSASVSWSGIIGAVPLSFVGRRCLAKGGDGARSSCASCRGRSSCVLRAACMATLRGKGFSRELTADRVDFLVSAGESLRALSLVRRGFLRSS